MNATQSALPILNPAEAPAGYRAELKPASDHRGNICRQCDWRPTCQRPNTDFLAYGHRCMSYAVVAVRDGLTYQRQDGCSVIFKKLAA